MVDGRLLAFLPKKKSKFRGIYQAKGCSRQIFFTNEPKKRDIPTFTKVKAFTFKAFESKSKSKVLSLLDFVWYFSIEMWK